MKLKVWFTLNRASTKVMLLVCSVIKILRALKVCALVKRIKDRIGLRKGKTTNSNDPLSEQKNLLATYSFKGLLPANMLSCELIRLLGNSSTSDLEYGLLRTGGSSLSFLQQKLSNKKPTSNIFQESIAHVCHM